MKIALVADTFSVEKGTGIARYSLEMLTGLLSKGLSVEPVAPEAPKVPLGLAINHALRMPYVVSRKARAFDLVHATSPITALGFPLVQKPRIVTYWDLISLLCRNTSTAFHTRLFAPLFLRVGRFADAIVASSSQTKEEMITHLDLPSDRISVVNPGVAAAFRPTRRPPRDQPVIGYVGALTRRKGIDYLLNAFRRLGYIQPGLPAKLALCGGKNGEYQALKKLAADLALDQYVEFRGFSEGEALIQQYNSFDILVLPSEWEGFGFTILEAQRCGVPVIIRQDAHIPPEVAQCCVKATSEQDMAEKMHELLTSRELRQAIIERALEYSRQFTWERTIRETLQVYESVLS